MASHPFAIVFDCPLPSFWHGQRCSSPVSDLSLTVRYGLC
ncbi:hypothetical protein PROPHIGD91-4_84 [Mycobacterium phage prophi91-4]|nr:hypothetical protein PROPHIGD91-4_84 [Mycobacterium phage prophi91-4]